MQITFKGNPVTLQGTQVKVGEKMPDFSVCNSDLATVSGSDLHGARVFLAVPSLDTGVCDAEVRKFNERAAELGVKIYAVSVDLPFAQARWCGANGVEAVKVFSDYQNRDFGYATGTFIEGICLLTRAVFVVDDKDTVIYAEYVPEITDHPDYEKIYKKLENLKK